MPRKPVTEKNSSKRGSTDVKGFALAVTAAARAEFRTFIEHLPAEQRIAVGTLKHWSPKDEVAHLTYWIDVFVTNVQAQRDGRTLIDTRDYLAMNDRAWQARKDWTWAEIEAALERGLAEIEAQISELNADDLIDPQRFTLEAERKSPRPLLPSLLYELIDHPLHHFIGMIHKFGNASQAVALLTRIESVLKQPGISKWTATSRRKIQTYAKEL